MSDASMPLATRVNHFFQHRSESERRVFERMRQALSLPTIVGRRAAAREIAADASFTIDRDRGYAVFPPETSSRRRARSSPRPPTSAATWT